MNNEIENCFECQITTPAKQTHPAKMTEIPTGPWSVLEIDFCRPFLDGK